MTIEQLREELELSLTWRSDELRMLKNNLSIMRHDEDKSKYRKTLIVMLYSHFEGFVKMSFLIYVKYINSLQIKRIDLKSKPELIASSMNDIFQSYDNKDKKNKLFKRQTNDDKFIHTIYRRADLINAFSDYMDGIVEVDDKVIDTESNLWSHVIEKNFYKLGIQHNIFKSSYKNIDQLVNLRNAISHGNKKDGIPEKLYNTLEKTIIKDTMSRLILILIREAKLLAIK